MACYHPVKAWRGTEFGSSGRRLLVFSPAKAMISEAIIELPCGQCIGCRLERSRQWAVRCMHEAALWEENCFITLTYRDAELPSDGSLNKRHWQLFMKRFRRAISPRVIRFFHCGEYGERFSRPHYHACIFGFDFPDKVLYSSRSGIPLYRSSLLEKLWPSGFSTIGDVTFESAAYVARYVTKKVTGKAAAAHYGGRLPEYATMSRRPGLGADWLKRYQSDVYPRDYVVTRGQETRPPRYYDDLLSRWNPVLASEVKSAREVPEPLDVWLGDVKPDETRERRLTRERVKYARFEQLIRGLETEQHG